jgi:hypothetical protein
MKNFILTTILLALGGCTTLTTTNKAEIAWQALNVVDTGQTLTVARNSKRWCESDPVTIHLVGQYPSEKSVLVTMAAFAIVHFAVTRFMDDRDTGAGPWHTANIIWQTATLTAKSFTVGRNFTVGIRPFGGRTSDTKHDETYSNGAWH